MSRLRVAWLLLACFLLGCPVVSMSEALQARLHSEWHVFHNPDGIFKIRADGSERVQLVGVEGEGDTVSVALWPALHPSGETLACVWAQGVARAKLEHDVFDATRLVLREIWDGGQRDILEARSPIPMFADSLELARSDPATWRFRSDQLLGLAYASDGKLACVERTLLEGDMVVLVLDPARGSEAEIYEFPAGGQRLSAWRGLSFSADGQALFLPRSDGWVQRLQLVEQRAIPSTVGYGLEAATSSSGDLALIGVHADSLGVPHGGAIEVMPHDADRSLQYRAVIRECVGISNLRWTADGQALLFEAHLPHPVWQGYRTRQLYVLDLTDAQHYFVDELQ